MLFFVFPHSPAFQGHGFQFSLFMSRRSTNIWHDFTAFEFHDYVLAFFCTGIFSVLDSDEQDTAYFPTSSSVPGPPELVCFAFTAPGYHSYLPVFVSLFVVHPEFVNPPL